MSAHTLIHFILGVHFSLVVLIVVQVAEPDLVIDSVIARLLLYEANQLVSPLVHHEKLRKIFLRGFSWGVTPQSSWSTKFTAVFLVRHNSAFGEKKSQLVAPAEQGHR